MPHATEPSEDQDQPREEQDQVDEAEILRQVLGEDGNLKELDLGLGEKADDAVDFGDLSDDDLADDEDESQSIGNDSEALANTEPKALENLAQDEDFGHQEGNGDLGNDFDDLFGEDPSSPVGAAADDSLAFDLGDGQNNSALEEQGVHGQLGTPDALQPFERREDQDTTDFRSTRDASKEAALSKEQQLQQRLFAMSKSGMGNSETIPQPPENADELLASLWPKFQRNTVPKFLDLLNPRKLRYQGKVPPKPPKAFQGTKLNLELAQDQEKSFKVSPAAGKQTREEVEMAGIMAVEGEATVETNSDGDVDLDSDYEKDTMRGVSWQDLQIMCEDWDVHSLTDSLASAERIPEEEPETDMEWPIAKVRMCLFHILNYAYR